MICIGWLTFDVFRAYERRIFAWNFKMQTINGWKGSKYTKLCEAFDNNEFIHDCIYMYYYIYE